MGSVGNIFSYAASWMLGAPPGWPNTSAVRCGGGACLNDNKLSSAATGVRKKSCVFFFLPNPVRTDTLQTWRVACSCTSEQFGEMKRPEGAVWVMNRREARPLAESSKHQTMAWNYSTKLFV